MGAPLRSVRGRTARRALTKWYVVCDDFRTQSYPTKQAAQAHLASILAEGACPLEHRIVEQVPPPRSNNGTFR